MIHWRRARRSSMALSLAILTVALAASACTTTTRNLPAPNSITPGFGINQDLHFDQSKIDPMIVQLKAMGLTWVRLQIIWKTIEQTPGKFSWGSYDVAFQKLNAAGIRPLGVLTDPPIWALPADCTDSACPPRSFAEFAAFAQEVAQRYKYTKPAWEVWNEPNIIYTWKPSPDAAAYTALLKASYSAIKKVDPAAPVISGGLSPTGNDPGRLIAPTDYLEAMYRTGARPYFDAVGWHPYIADPPNVLTIQDDSAWPEMQDTPVSARSIMAANGDSAKEIWATEFGVSTQPGVQTEEVQAETLSRAINLWCGYTFAGPLFIYNYRDKGTDPGNDEDFYGIVSADDDRPKPAVHAVTTAVHACRKAAP